MSFICCFFFINHFTYENDIVVYIYTQKNIIENNCTTSSCTTSGTRRSLKKPPAKASPKAKKQKVLFG